MCLLTKMLITRIRRVRNQKSAFLEQLKIRIMIKSLQRTHRFHQNLSVQSSNLRFQIWYAEGKKQEIRTREWKLKQRKQNICNKQVEISSELQNIMRSKRIIIKFNQVIRNLNKTMKLSKAIKTLKLIKMG